MDATGFLKIETPTVAEPWRTVLLDAAAEIERVGWCPEDYGCGGTGPKGEKCIAAAFGVVGPSVALSMAALDAFQAYVKMPTVKFNRRCTSAAEVCETLRQCARS